MRQSEKPEFPYCAPIRTCSDNIEDWHPHLQSPSRHSSLCPRTTEIALIRYLIEHDSFFRVELTN